MAAIPRRRFRRGGLDLTTTKAVDTSKKSVTRHTKAVIARLNDETQQMDAMGRACRSHHYGRLAVNGGSIRWRQHHLPSSLGTSVAAPMGSQLPHADPPPATDAARQPALRSQAIALSAVVDLQSDMTGSAEERGHGLGIVAVRFHGRGVY